MLVSGFERRHPPSRRCGLWRYILAGSWNSASGQPYRPGIAAERPQSGPVHALAHTGDSISAEMVIQPAY